MKTDFIKGYVSQQGDYISMRADITEAMSYFENLDVNKKQISRKVFNRIGDRSAKAAKKNFGSVLRRRSGDLRDSIGSHYYDDKVFQWIEIYPEADTGKATGNHSGNNGGFRYGWALGAGYTVVATKEHPSKHGNRTILRFQADGKWVSTHSIHVEPKDFVETPVKKFIASPQCKKELDKIVFEQLKYWEKRIKKGYSYKGKK